MLIYKQIESFFEDLQLKHLSKYFASQAQHEKEHGDMFLSHINSRTGGKVSLESVIFPDIGLNDLLSVAHAYVSVEEQTTESIEELYDLAFNEKSYIDLPFIETMLQEQVSEEDEAQEFVTKLQNVKDIVLFDATFGG